MNYQASAVSASHSNGGLRAVEQYNFPIHILAMLLMGFGFLMVFVRNYGYSELTGTSLVVGVGLPLYLLLRSAGVISAEPNAALAGGISIGATCNQASPLAAFAIGAAAGAICVVGYTWVQPKLQKALKLIDTCGVHNLHGMPGLFGGLVALALVPGIAKAQISGIVITVVLASVTGLVAGYLIKATGEKIEAYED